MCFYICCKMTIHFNTWSLKKKKLNNAFIIQLVQLFEQISHKDLFFSNETHVIYKLD